MRIIAGKARGRKLLGPKNEGKDPVTGTLKATRPTLDRVKEAMFNIMGHRIPGSTCLDLFAGTGSLGLEAASRGARQVYLVDSFRETYDLLVENIQKLGFNKECQALFQDYRQALSDLARQGVRLDIIFIDPPYLNDMIPQAMGEISSADLLAPGGLILGKVDSRETISDEVGEFQLVMSRKYGHTSLVFYRRASELEEAEANNRAELQDSEVATSE